ncbi:MAG: IMP cyclohydrolase, partial [Deltaproteobacteria bacterium]|nr:IMP cyclohydrolase [Deltaproteobacteria bacterium]
MSEIKQMYRTLMEDHFPPDMTISFGDQTLVYRKRTWKLPDESGELIEKGLRYGENPGQEAAVYELVSGNLTLGGCTFLEPGQGLVSALAEENMLQAGKHPGKTNLTDVDNGLNILKYLSARPTAAILKHNNPCGAAQASDLATAYARANRADRIAAFGGALVVNRPLDRA